MKILALLHLREVLSHLQSGAEVARMQPSAVAA